MNYSSKAKLMLKGMPTPYLDKYQVLNFYGCHIHAKVQNSLGPRSSNVVTKQPLSPFVCKKFLQGRKECIELPLRSQRVMPVQRSLSYENLKVSFLINYTSPEKDIIILLKQQTFENTSTYCQKQLASILSTNNMLTDIDQPSACNSGRSLGRFSCQPFLNCKRNPVLFLLLLQHSRIHSTVHAMIVRKLVKVTAVLIAAFEVSAGFSNPVTKSSTGNSDSIPLGTVKIKTFHD